MDSSRYLESLAADFALLRAAATAGADSLTRPVPTCPGWTVADLVRHVGEVYLHKTLAMRLGDFPGEQDWPAEVEALPPLDLLDQTYANLRHELTTRAPDSAAPSWYQPESTVAFWRRRMAQETVIHRLDAELAAQAAIGSPVSPVPSDIAADGVDEVLIRFLGYGSTVWADEFASLRGPRLETAGGDDTVLSRPRARAGRCAPVPATLMLRPGPAEKSMPWSGVTRNHCCAGCGAGARTTSGGPAIGPGPTICAGSSSPPLSNRSVDGASRQPLPGRGFVQQRTRRSRQELVVDLGRQVRFWQLPVEGEAPDGEQALSLVALGNDLADSACPFHSSSLPPRIRSRQWQKGHMTVTSCQTSGILGGCC